MDGVASFLSACQALVRGDLAQALPTLGLPAGLLLLGLVGGASHCAAMCGPFVLAQTGRRLAAQPLRAGSAGGFGLALVRLSGTLLLPYHLGRMTVYTGLGGLAAALLGGVAPIMAQGRLPGLILLIAAVIFLGQALAPWIGPLQLLPQGASGGRLGQALARRLAPLFAAPTMWGGYLIGLGLGFLPCGLIYAALVAAGASGSFFSGASAMFAFALGTMPALIVVSWLGNRAGQRFREALRWWLLPVLLLNSATAAVTGLRWLGLL